MHNPSCLSKEGGGFSAHVIFSANLQKIVAEICIFKIVFYLFWKYLQQNPIDLFNLPDFCEISFPGNPALLFSVGGGAWLAALNAAC